MGPRLHISESGRLQIQALSQADEVPGATDKIPRVQERIGMMSSWPFGDI
jgi:hypothetical protein